MKGNVSFKFHITSQVHITHNSHLINENVSQRKQLQQQPRMYHSDKLNNLVGNFEIWNLKWKPKETTKKVEKKQEFFSFSFCFV